MILGTREPSYAVMRYPVTSFNSTPHGLIRRATPLGASAFAAFAATG
jgi:hypothetical protein